MSKNQKKFLRPSDPVPEDVHWEWIEVVKALQAACSGNQGYARLNVTISVNKNKPVLWVTEYDAAQAVLPPGYKLVRISPRRLADTKLTYETALALVSQND